MSHSSTRTSLTMKESRQPSMHSPHSRPTHTRATLIALQHPPHLYQKAQLFLTQQPTLPPNTRHGHDGYTLGPFMPQHIHGCAQKKKSYEHSPTTSSPSHGYDSLAKYSCCGPTVPQPSPTSFNTSINSTPQSNSLANSYTVSDMAICTQENQTLPPGTDSKLPNRLQTRVSTIHATQARPTGTDSIYNVDPREQATKWSDQRHPVYYRYADPTRMSPEVQPSQSKWLWYTHFRELSPPLPFPSPYKRHASTTGIWHTHLGTTPSSGSQCRTLFPSPCKRHANITGVWHTLPLGTTPSSGSHPIPPLPCKQHASASSGEESATEAPRVYGTPSGNFLISGNRPNSLPENNK